MERQSCTVLPALSGGSMPRTYHCTPLEIIGRPRELPKHVYLAIFRPGTAILRERLPAAL